jgi:PBSX family phage terminase large subunit
VNDNSSAVRTVTEIRGAPARLFNDLPPEVVIAGAAGTGKTRAILEWIHRRCEREKIRVLMLRKTFESLKASALVTFQEQVLHEFDGTHSQLDGVRYFGGNRIFPAGFYYDTGSRLIMGGMDRSSKVLSTEYDVIYVNEVTELTLDDWEKLSGRTDRPRTGAAAPASVLVGDCNPDAPTHWIKQRSVEGKLALWRSRHEDNPAMWDRKTMQWTAAGQRYLERLDGLTGVRYRRLRLGEWVAAEGLVYDGWDSDAHLAQPFTIPHGWPRYWVVDFGYVHPFVMQWWAEDPDGRLYRYREIYMTRRLVEDHVELAMRLSADEPRPTAIVVDHDAEDRATFERKSGYSTTAAKKNVSAGIQAVAERLRPVNGKPRLIFFRDSLVERDRELAEHGLPTCTEDEFGSYVWNLAASRRKGEEPMKDHDHGLDAARYLVAHRDLTGAQLRPVSGALADYLRLQGESW